MFVLLYLYYWAKPLFVFLEQKDIFNYAAIEVSIAILFGNQHLATNGTDWANAVWHLVKPGLKDAFMLK